MMNCVQVGVNFIDNHYPFDIRKLIYLIFA